MLSAITNTSSLSATNALNRTSKSLQRVTQRLATGRRINSGKDDPAGLIAAERLSSEIKSVEAQSRALERADAFANIAEGNAAQLSGLFGDLNSLVVASANQAGLSPDEIAANQLQIDNTVASIERFTGDATSSLDFVDLPDGGNATVEALYNDALGAAAAVRSGGPNDLSSGNFEAAQTALQTATLDIAKARGHIGTFQKDVIGPQIRSNQIARENLISARSIIADTDFAAETANLKRDQILAFAGVKVLAIAQQQTKSILDLFA